MSRPLPTPPIKRLLLVRNDHLGDLVLSLPAFSAARRALPHTRIAALVSPAAAALLAGNADVDEVLIDQPETNSAELADRLRSLDFDAALVMAAYTRNCLAVWRAGIPRRVMWAFKPAGLLLGNRRLFVHRNRPPLHESEFALCFVRRLGLEVPPVAEKPRLKLDPAARERVRERIARELGTQGPLFGVHPGNFKNAYNWSPARYAELIARLAKHGRVMVTGGPSEGPLLAEVRGLAKVPPHASVGYYHDLSLPELLAALAEQQVLTASSTGPMHLAGALGTPVVALFSRLPCHSPDKWRPFGASNTILQPPLMPGESTNIPTDQGTAHMERLSVAEVLAANLKSLKIRNALPAVPIAA